MSLEQTIFEYLDDVKRANRTTVLNLGGASGANGGVGGPPGGFIGKLPQGRVTYDETEAESDYTPPSGTSLVDNLNHIRYRLQILEASGIGGAGASISVKQSGVLVATGINALDFYGATIEQVITTAKITISGGVGSGDMNKSTYDTDNDGIVDNSEQLQGHNSDYFSISGHVHPASDITSGTIGTARLGTGTANSNTFLRGDSSWATISGVSGSGSTDILAVQVFS